MKFSLILSSMVFLSQLAFAQTQQASQAPLTEADKSLARQQIEKAEKKKAKGVEQVKAYTAKLAKIQEDMKACKEKKGWKYCEEAGQSESDLKDFEKDTQDLIKAWGKDITEADAAIAPLKAKMTADERRKTDEVMGVIRQNRNELQAELSVLKFDRATLGRDIDKMAIGQYVTAKMGLMLNSRAFCESTNRCTKAAEGTPGNYEVSAADMKEIFPDMAEVLGDAKYWSEANKNRGSGKSATPAAKPAGTK
ncbi:MAG: hypothetical protein ACXWC9_02115 [Pseudobdellovibrionaceae bacterium]